MQIIGGPKDKKAQFNKSMRVRFSLDRDIEEEEALN